MQRILKSHHFIFQHEERKQKQFFYISENAEKGGNINGDLP